MHAHHHGRHFGHGVTLINLCGYFCLLHEYFNAHVYNCIKLLFLYILRGPNKRKNMGNCKKCNDSHLNLKIYQLTYHIFL